MGKKKLIEKKVSSPKFSPKSRELHPRQKTGCFILAKNQGARSSPKIRVRDSILANKHTPRFKEARMAQLIVFFGVDCFLAKIQHLP